MVSTMTCVECGDELGEERVQLGYRYCTKQSCQALHHRGVAVTGIGINKSAESFIVADPDEIRRRGEAGEFAKKDSALGLDYRGRFDGPAAPTRPARPDRAARSGKIPSQRREPPRRVWTPAQEKIVRLYHDMGLSPRQIAERARENAPKLAITERLAVQILSSHKRG
ncbi:MAG: hypothetical protein QOI36_2675 [Pseudonocardiales bacterium]|nr:hypothetical protein [Pseudonocardia sp.]MDT7651269.1 hypothetical protein [Pseudonocardiales bacterium]